MIIGNKEFDLDNNAYIMGILNVTPDSFSDGGKYNSIEKALSKAQELIDEGCHILDIGGESTRPEHIKISENEEIERVCPIIEAVKKSFDIPISLDTYKNKVAYEGIKSGADLINDIWGLKWDSEIAKTVANGNVAICIMHNRDNMNYNNFMDDIILDLYKSLEIAKAAGIKEEKIILDPGIGFAKDLNMNLVTMKNLDKIKEIGYPVLLGTSRKSFIGRVLDLEVDQREEGTIATSVFGLTKGCSIFRVHNVKENKRAIEMTKAMINASL